MKIRDFQSRDLWLRVAGHRLVVCKSSAEMERKMEKRFGIKEVVAIGIGTALFVALTQVQIPLGLPNTYLQPRMAVLAFLAAVFGPVVGGVVGVIGHALGDAFFLRKCMVELGISGSCSWNCNRSVCSKVCN